MSNDSSTIEQQGGVREGGRGRGGRDGGKKGGREGGRDVRGRGGCKLLLQGRVKGEWEI